MNAKQLRILNVLHRVKNPSMHGIAVMTGIPLSTLSYHLRVLAGEGYVQWEPRRARTLQPTARTALIKVNGRCALVEVIYSDPVK